MNVYVPSDWLKPVLVLRPSEQVLCRARTAGCSPRTKALCGIDTHPPSINAVDAAPKQCGDDAYSVDSVWGQGFELARRQVHRCIGAELGLDS